jgi:DNA polymerase III subunit chi
MPEIVFYYNVRNKLEVMKKLATKAYGSGLAVLVFARDQALQRRLDQFLWSDAALSFLPHVNCQHPLASETPILVGDDAGKLARRDILINMEDQVPDCYVDFARVLEIVGEDLQDRDRSRPRYHFYKTSGFDLVMHDMQAAA